MILRGESVPSLAQEVLRLIMGAPIRKVARFSWWSPEESAIECNLEDSEVFSYTEGPLLIYLESGEVVGMSSDEAKNSVVVWLEQDVNGNLHEESLESNDEFFPVANDDGRFCGGIWRDVSGKKVVEIFVVKCKARNVMYGDLPNEVGLRMILEDGGELFVCHKLFDRVSNFSVSEFSALEGDVLGELNSFCIL
ncbi:hypothetical protein [Metapseudomonas otitidis]|uniref:hypothetical protein n=1 Tax=Metapseudomonas otitidis TaxID=319939 RepID=UPI00209864A8|nr:hypothetical protein [Pseudomonas otitidis]MCO7552698.1 hypothetical protein [Pseudomonas otitidis]